MHPRNIFASEPPNIKGLAANDERLRPYLNKLNSIDFHNQEAVCVFTTCILQHYLDLTVEIRPDRLCPTVPSRLNYILWIQDLLDSDHFDLEKPGHPLPVRGLDIGTGASCIYPLLGCKLRSSWTFIATDIDDSSLRTAESNVRSNAMADRITTRLVAPNDPFFDLCSEPLDFTMCNPPFYSSTEDRQSSQSAKATVAHTSIEGTDAEMITSGGEVQFVMRMIDESGELSKRDSRYSKTWYTSLLGKLDSLRSIVTELRDRGVTNYAIAEIMQGQYTRRWAIAWRYGFERPVPALTRPTEPAPSVAVRQLLPSHTGATVAFDPGTIDSHGLDRLYDTLQRAHGDTMSLEIKEMEHQTYILGSSLSGNVWSRSFKRRKKLIGSGLPQSGQYFAFRIFLDLDRHRFTVHWKSGYDYGVFESFCGMLKTTITLLQQP